MSLSLCGPLIHLSSIWWEPSMVVLLMMMLAFSGSSGKRARGFRSQALRHGRRVGCLWPIPEAEAGERTMRMRQRLGQLHRLKELSKMTLPAMKFYSKSPKHVSAIAPWFFTTSSSTSLSPPKNANLRHDSPIGSPAPTQNRRSSTPGLKNP